MTSAEGMKLHCDERPDDYIEADAPQGGAWLILGVATEPPAKSVLLEPGKASALRDFITAWLVEHGHEEASKPSVRLRGPHISTGVVWDPPPSGYREVFRKLWRAFPRAHVYDDDSVYWESPEDFVADVDAATGHEEAGSKATQREFAEELKARALGRETVMTAAERERILDAVIAHPGPAVGSVTHAKAQARRETLIEVADKLTAASERCPSVMAATLRAAAYDVLRMAVEP